MSAQKDRLLAAAELLNMTPDDLLTALDRPIFPETLVGIARERQNRILDRPRVDPEDARTLARCFRELDIHLSAGGDLPDEWQPRQAADDSPRCTVCGESADLVPESDAVLCYEHGGGSNLLDDEPWPADVRCPAWLGHAGDEGGEHRCAGPTGHAGQHDARKGSWS